MSYELPIYGKIKPHLVAFGCSLTYGHGLSDCHIHPNLPGLKPSDQAWPKLLAEMLDMQCINLSAPGSSNFAILLSLINHKFSPHDTCIIMWTYLDRDLIIHDNGRKEKIGSWINKSRFISWLDVNPDQTIHLRFWSWITLVFAWLENQGVKSYFLLPESNLYGQCPTWAEHIKFLTADIKTIRKKYPKALDNHHPGQEAHQVFAKEIFEEIS